MVFRRRVRRRAARRIAPAALLAVVAALVPASTAGFAQELEAQAAGTVHFVNGHPLTQVSDPIDICLGTEALATDLANGDSADIDLPGGNQAISVAVSPETCAGTTTPIAGGIDVLGGAQVTVILGPAPGEATQGVNDTSATPPDTTRLTLRNGTPVLGLGICLDGELVDGSQIPTGATQTQVEAPSGPHDLTLFLLNQCQTADAQSITLAACTNLVLNFYATGGDSPFDADNQLFIVGCELPASDNDVTAFCAVLPELQGLPDELAALFATTDVNDPATFPSVDALQALIERINELLAAGDAVVPATVEPQWQIATDGLRQLVAGLTTASFDFQFIVDNSPDQAQEILDGVRGEGPPDPETDAAIGVLTVFFLDNCIPAGTPASVTPASAPPTAAPAAPVAGTARLTG